MFSLLVSRIIRFNKPIYNIPKVYYCKQYTNKEEWIQKIDNNYHIGISQSAKDQLGDLVFIEFQFDKNDEIKKDEEIIILESVKASDSINAPFDCILVDNNTKIEDNLDIVNNDPENTWFIKIKKK
jgi:glycine cleavage system H protein